MEQALKYQYTKPTLLILAEEELQKVQAKYDSWLPRVEKWKEDRSGNFYNSGRDKEWIRINEDLNKAQEYYDRVLLNHNKKQTMLGFNGEETHPDDRFTNIEEKIEGLKDLLFQQNTVDPEEQSSNKKSDQSIAVPVIIGLTTLIIYFIIK